MHDKRCAKNEKRKKVSRLPHAGQYTIKSLTPPLFHQWGSAWRPRPFQTAAAASRQIWSKEGKVRGSAQIDGSGTTTYRNAQGNVAYTVQGEKTIADMGFIAFKLLE